MKREPTFDQLLEAIGEYAECIRVEVNQGGERREVAVRCHKWLLATVNAIQLALDIVPGHPDLTSVEASMKPLITEIEKNMDYGYFYDIQRGTSETLH